MTFDPTTTSLASLLRGTLVVFQEFIREGCLHKLTKKGLQQRMFFLVCFSLCPKLHFHSGKNRRGKSVRKVGPLPASSIPGMNSGGLSRMSNRKQPLCPCCLFVPSPHSGRTSRANTKMSSWLEKCAGGPVAARGLQCCPETWVQGT